MCDGPGRVGLLAIWGQALLLLLYVYLLRYAKEGTATAVARSGCRWAIEM